MDQLVRNTGEKESALQVTGEFSDKTHQILNKPAILSLPNGLENEKNGSDAKNPVKTIPKIFDNLTDTKRDLSKDRDSQFEL